MTARSSDSFTFLTELDAAVRQAHESGGFTEVHRLAQERQLELRAQPVTDKVMWQIRKWAYVENRSHEYAANEALGWTILADGSCAKTLPNGRILSSISSVSYEEDGETVDTAPDERWLQRHRNLTRRFGMRARGERLRNARTRAQAPQRRSRERRPGATRRASSSSTTSSADPGSDSDPEPPAVVPWRWASEVAWRNFVESVESSDFERELYLERMHGGWSR